MRKVIIIEGKACSGKETIAKKFASEMNYTYINAGLIFRATVYSILRNINPQYEKYVWKNGKSSFMLGGKDITRKLSALSIGKSTAKMANTKKGFILLASKVKLLAKDYNNIIVDGVGMRTIFPEAKYHFYLIAPIKIRAERRLKDLLRQNIKTTYELVYKDLEYRDRYDTTRTFYSLKKSKNSIVIDTSKTSITESVNIIKNNLMRLI